MSKDYVADNAGTGFASFDDDGPSDLDSLLAGAALGEEPDDQDTASYFSDAEPDAYTPPSKEATKSSSRLQNSYERDEPKAAEPKAPVSTMRLADEEEYEDLPAEEATPYVEPVAPVDPPRQRSWEMDPNPILAPQAAPVAQPVYTPPVQHSFSAPRFEDPKPASSRRALVSNETDEIALAGKIIRIIDAYRKLNGEVQTVASQFITNGSEVIEDEATLVVKVLNVDPMLSATMKSLREAKDLDPVERVFHIISLQDDVLHSLGGLVSVFNGNALDGSLDKINYARQLVREIEQLEPRAVNYVESTESILAAADGESN